MAGGGIHPPLKVRVECVSKTLNSAFFVGMEANKEDEEVTLTYHGDTGYFHINRKYDVTFDPLIPHE